MPQPRSQPRSQEFLAELFAKVSAEVSAKVSAEVPTPVSAKDSFEVLCLPSAAQLIVIKPELYMDEVTYGLTKLHTDSQSYIRTDKPSDKHIIPKG